MTFETLYHKGKNGELRQWRVYTEGDTIYTEHGLVGGQLQTSSSKAEGKNIGKRNETTPDKQAELEAKSLWTYKVERKYSKTPEEAAEPVLLPMLIPPNNEKNIVFPGLAQPKLNGYRALAYWENGKVKLLSRGGKEWTDIPHINEQVAKILSKDSMFDGELYTHGRSLQKLGSNIKKAKEDSVTIDYHIYDMPIVGGNDSLIQTERDKYRLQILSGNGRSGMLAVCPNLLYVSTYLVNSQEELNAIEAEALDDGYEGLVYRKPNGIYQFGHRSRDLVKIKQFVDSEFKVIGFTEGRGKFKGCAVFTCQNDLADNTFDVVAPGTMKDKAEFFENAELYIGRLLTVKYARERSDELKPLFPVGLAFRLEEDL